VKQPKARRHGAAVSAPPEEFAIGESPPPAKVGAGRASRTSVPAANPSFGDRVVGGVKLFLGLLIVVGASSAVAYSLHRYALGTARFGIQKIELTGAKRFGKAQIQTLAGIEIGKNLFAFDTAEAEKKLLTDPWISSARVVRELPNSLRVELSEREAVAVAVLGDRPFLVTREGEPFKPVKAEDPTDLPVLTGVSTADLARDRVAAIDRLKTGLDLLRQYDRLAASRVHPAEEVALAQSGHAVLTVGQKGIALELGRPPYARKLAMGAQVLAELGAKGRTPGIVFLDNEAHPERVVVRMR
jgi:cell division protein FtsQ